MFKINITAFKISIEKNCKNLAYKIFIDSHNIFTLFILLLFVNINIYKYKYIFTELKYIGVLNDKLSFENFIVYR